MRLTRLAVEKLGIEVELLFVGQIRSPLGIRNARAKIAAAARGADLVHAQYGSACGMAAAGAALGVPFILTVRGSDWHLFDDPRRLLYFHTRAARWMTTRACKRAEKIVVVSQRLRGEVESIAKPSRIQVIPTAIDLEQWRVRCCEPPATDSVDVLFTSVDENNPIKRTWIAKESVRLASLKDPRIRLRLATGVPHREMPAIVRSCRVALCTSVYEGWPNSIKEALASNVPFVSTDVSDLRLIADKEPSCKIVEANPAAVATALLDVLREGRSAQLDSHVQSMGLPHVGALLAKVYRECV